MYVCTYGGRHGWDLKHFKKHITVKFPECVPRRGYRISTYYQRYLLSGLVYVHEVYTGTE